MERKFIYQDAKSDKFWDIEFEGTTQTVVYGKTGTTGREAVKEFATAEECTKESEKLITQKLKKKAIPNLPKAKQPLRKRVL